MDMKRLLHLFNNCRLRTKLLISYVSLVVILLVFWGGSAYNQINRHLLENARSDFHNTFSFACLLLENKIARAERTLTLMAEDPSVSGTFSTMYLSQFQQAQSLLDRFDPLLANVNQQNEYLSGVRIYTYYGLKGTRSYIKDAAAVTGTEAESLSCGSDPRWWFDGENLTISVKSVNQNQPQYAATVTYLIDREIFFGDCLQDQNLDYRFLVYGDDGRELFCQESITDEAVWYGNGRHLLQEEQTIPTGWRVSLEINADPMMVPVTATLRSTLIAVAIALLLIIPLIMLLSFSFSKRIRVLKEQVAQIVPRKYEMDISSPNKDEIGDITNAVGSLVQDTRQIILESYQETIARRDAQIQALQAQINPHFLYNTLSNLNWRAIARSDLDTSNLLNALSRFYRLSLNNGRIISTISQELEHVRLYMRIQCGIHGTELAEEAYEVDEDLLDYEMPSIILQPLVENAVEHGIGAVGFENGRLNICVHEEEGNIVIRVCDNGPGMSPAAAAAVLEQESEAPGYGLRNVYRRLHLFFDNQCDMRFDETPGGGSTVVLEIPPYVQP